MTDTGEHRYTYPDSPPSDPPADREEPRTHRATPERESDAQLVLRAIGWAMFYGVMAYDFADYALQLPAARLFGICAAAGTLVGCARRRRR